METALDTLIKHMKHDLKAARAELHEKKDITREGKAFLMGRISVLREYISRFNTGVGEVLNVD